jgi:hypothetical protein
VTELTLEQRQAKREALAKHLRAEGAAEERRAIVAFLRLEGSAAEQVIGDIDEALGLTRQDAARYARRIGLTADAIVREAHHRPLGHSGET